jgi:hypothetical protein
VNTQRGALVVVHVSALVMAGSGCHSVAQPGSHAIAEARKDPALVSDAEAPRRASEDAGPTANALVTAPPLRWGKIPDAAGEVFTAIEGHCPDLGVSVLANATLVHYSGRVIARVSGDALEKVSAKFEAGDVANIQNIRGRWPDAAFLAYDNGGRCSFAQRALRFVETTASWKPAFALGENHGVREIQPYLNGALGLRDCSSCGTTSDVCKENTFVTSGPKLPPMTGDGFTVSEYSTLPTGEVFAIGSVCGLPNVSGCTGQFRWWTPGGKLGWDVLGTIPSTNLGHLLVRSKTDVVVSQGGYLGTFDGAKLKRLTAPAKTSFGALVEAGADGFWVLTDDDTNGAPGGKILHRKPDGTYTDVTPPKARTVRSSDSSIPVGVALGTPWTFAGDDVYKREAGAWRKVELPKPSFAFSAKSFFTPLKIHVAAPDDVWILAQYFEKQANWDFREVRTALLRTKPLKETFRCDGTFDPAKPAGFFVSWPAAANDACKTPFLLLAPISATSPKDFDYPQTRAVLRPKSALVADGKIREIRENGNVWIGVVPRSVEDGRTLADHYAKHFPLSRAELVCAEANVTRAIAIDSPK